MHQGEGRLEYQRPLFYLSSLGLAKVSDALLDAQGL